MCCSLFTYNIPISALASIIQSHLDVSIYDCLGLYLERVKRDMNSRPTLKLCFQAARNALNKALLKLLLA